MAVYQINEAVRVRLKHPFGKLLIGPSNGTTKILKEEIKQRKDAKLFVIGDVVASNIIRSGIHIDLIIIDRKSRREPVEFLPLKDFEVINVKNPPGVITALAYEIIEKMSQASSATAIIVDGEEDLLTLPVIKFAPLGTFVVYGQPHVGIVLVQVTKKVKREVEFLLEQMRKTF